ncbi:class I SAM-dependent methyltransferase [Nocardia sp. CWNU-33]|uniref:class I SAM-dependent methyltransferase n=1 Tax=Nocardia sp. CWNU-33 TaxID=3392117 RepID=UPI00398F022E
MVSEFDRHLDAFRRYQETPWGRLRYEQVATNLARHLPHRPLRVLDVGGGNGLDALHLAALGHRVTIGDTSQASLDEAITLAGSNGCTELLETRLADIEALAGVAAEGSFVWSWPTTCSNTCPAGPKCSRRWCRSWRPGACCRCSCPTPPATR